MDCAGRPDAVPLSASHAHSLANLRKTPDEVVQDIARIRAARDARASTQIEGRHEHRFRLHLAGDGGKRAKCCA
jgi:hydroxymethylglutaryl-CoA lyase